MREAMLSVPRTLAGGCAGQGAWRPNDCRIAIRLEEAATASEVVRFHVETVHQVRAKLKIDRLLEFAFRDREEEQQNAVSSVLRILRNRGAEAAFSAIAMIPAAEDGMSSGRIAERQKVSSCQRYPHRAAAAVLEKYEQC